MNKLFAFPVLLLGLTACEPREKRIPTVPVTGSVAFADQKPAANATVVFHPTDPAVDIRPRGTVATDGTFKLTSYDGHDGAPAGKYRVTVELWTTARQDDGPSNRLPAKFAKPETSGLEATIGPEATKLDPIVLKR